MTDLQPGDMVWWQDHKNKRMQGAIKRISDPPRWVTVVWPHPTLDGEWFFQLISIDLVRKV